MEMVKCTDCVHYAICSHYKDNRYECDFFMNHKNTVEVVRCNDCEYCEEAFDDYWCNYNWNYAPKNKPKLTRADGFCHNGERREGE